MHSHRVAAILSELTIDDEHATLPDRLCATCQTTLPVTGAGVALMTAAGPSGVVLAATDSRARELEELQFALGEGPCVGASGSGHPVLEADLTVTGPARWPRFGAAVRAAGARAVFAFPLRVGATRVGVLDLYRDTPGPLTDTELTEALAFADAATVVILHLQDTDDRGAGEPTLTGPIDGRAVVHQATGMITIQLGIGVAEALQRLRGHAYATGRTVSDIAADVVSRRLHFEPDHDLRRDGGSGP